MATENPNTQPSDIVGGDKITAGDITNIARDKNIYGDEVHGDKVLGDKVIIQEAPKLRIPLQRPARAEHFVDRETALAQLVNDLQLGRIVMLCGPGGIGKSALAAEALWQLAPGNTPPHRFPDGIIYHDFYREPQVALVFEKIARSFNKEPHPTPAAAAQIELAGRQLLLVLDGTEQADDLQALLQIRDQCGVLVVSRKHEESISQWADLSPLPPADAVALLQAWGKQRATNRQVAERICAFIGYLPLAVRLAGSYLSTRGREAEEYIKWLETTPLANWNQGKQQHDSVPVLLEQNLAQVSAAARQVMGVIGCLALAPFDQAMIAAGLDANIPIDTALDELVNYSLLVRRDSLYEVAHALIHTYARQQLSPPTATAISLAAYYQQVIEQSQGDLPRLNGLRPHIMVLLRIAHQRGAWDTITSLAWSIEDYLDLQGYWSDRILTIETAVTAAQATQNRQAEGAWLGNLGNAYRNLGQVEQAIGFYQQALAIAKEIGDRSGEGNHLGNLGVAYRNLGQVEQAIAYHKQALAIAKEIGDRRGEGNHLGSLGNAYRNLGQVEQAIGFFQQALAITKEIGDGRNEGNWLGNLGGAYHSLGQVEQAIGFYQQAIAISKAIGDRRGEGADLGSLGLAYADLGQIEQAIAFYQQALAIAKDIGDRRGEGNRLGNLGLAYADLGQIEQAIAFYQQALVIAKEIGDRRNEGIWLGSLGVAYADLGQVEQARQLWQNALSIFEEIKSPTVETVRRLLSSLQPENPAHP